MLGLTAVTVTGGSTAKVPTKTSLSVASSLNETPTSPCTRGGTAHSTRPSPTEASATTAASWRRGTDRITQATRSSAIKTSPVATTTVAERPLEMKRVASLNPAEGTAVKLRTGAVTALNSSREAPASLSCNTADINRKVFNPRADAMHASTFSAQPSSEHTLCTTRPHTSTIAILTFAAAPTVAFTLTFTTPLSPTNNGEAFCTLFSKGRRGPLQSNCRGDPTTCNTNDVSIQPV